MYIYIYIQTYVHIYIYTHIYIYICIYTTFNPTPQRCGKICSGLWARGSAMGGIPCTRAGGVSGRLSHPTPNLKHPGADKSAAACGPGALLCAISSPCALYNLMN